MFDHEKFKGNEKFDGFMEHRGQRIDFYKVLKLDLQAPYFGFDTKKY